MTLKQIFIALSFSFQLCCCHLFGAPLDHWLAFVPSRVGALQAINIPENTTRPPIATPSGISAVAITPDGKTVYSVNIITPRIDIFDVETNSNIGTLTPTVSQLTDIAISSDGTTAYMVTRGPAGVLPLNIATNQLEPLIPIGGGIVLRDIAVTPDGTKAYVTGIDLVNSIGYLIPVDLVTGIVGPNINLGSVSVNEIVITPDGSTAYLPTFPSPSVITVDVATNTIGTTITGFTHNTIHIAMAPDGKNVYVGSTSNGITTINTNNNTLGQTFNVSLGGAGSLFVTPDSKTAYVVNNSSGSVISLNLVTGETSSDITVGSIPDDIKITPDQAPLAAFTVKLRFIGEPSRFDASSSSSPVGTIVSYQWDFGDGTILETSNPKVSHVYQSTGNFIVNLTVVNSAGTSTTRTYTGQVVGNNGGPTATISQQVTIQEVSAPSNFRGIVFKNRFLNETEYLLKSKLTLPHLLEWLNIEFSLKVAWCRSSLPQGHLDLVPV